jgi:hypothetical protein
MRQIIVAVTATHPKPTDPSDRSVPMALVASYEKVRESPTEVEYSFGYPEMDRRLVINKQDRTSQATGGTDDPTFRTTAGKILYQQSVDGAWPSRGMVAA